MICQQVGALTAWTRRALHPWTRISANNQVGAAAPEYQPRQEVADVAHKVSLFSVPATLPSRVTYYADSSGSRRSEAGGVLFMVRAGPLRMSSLRSTLARVT